MPSDTPSVREVEPIPQDLTPETEASLRRVDALRIAWETSMANASREDLEARRDRSLRRHAIETGIIERLYDIEWGVTEALIADGLTMQAASADGTISEATLATVRSQLNALEFLTKYVTDDRELSPFFIRQVHELITATQDTYDAHDSLGHPIQATLPKGVWKKSPNSVRRPDGSVMQFTPPERVQDQIETLLSQYEESRDSFHPIVLAAWFHHRFICIHPFADGNGRVARALTLLVLLQAKLAPLVVDRDTRGSYIDALDAANIGDLEPLIRLFGRLEEVALQSEMEVTPPKEIAGSVLDVSRAWAARLKVQLQATDAERRELVDALSREIIDRSHALLEKTGQGIAEAFAEVDSTTRSAVQQAVPPSNEARYYRRQIYRSAKEVSFFSNIEEGAWWSRLHIHVLGFLLRYAVVLQKVGRGETGLIAVTVFAERLVSQPESSGEAEEPVPLIRLSAQDSITLLHSDSAEDRWEEVAGLIERTLAASVDEFARSLG
ncbi:Fic family protein [Microbacterium schleiferi]|uniref:Fic family protein n=1 Tax=Microbacterium schleiferi TaxID=69362 RepID=A0ABU7V863_9MICO